MQTQWEYKCLIHVQNEFEFLMGEKMSGQKGRKMERGEGEGKGDKRKRKELRGR